MSYSGPLKAVILDWAGTTVDFGSFAPAVPLGGGEQARKAATAAAPPKQSRMVIGRLLDAPAPGPDQFRHS